MTRHRIIAAILCAAACALAGERQPAPPDGVHASDGACADRIILAWQGSQGATMYGICRSLGPNSNDDTLYTNVPPHVVRFIDRAVVSGTTYYYRVCAADTNGWGTFGKDDAGFARPRGAEWILGIESRHPARGIRIVAGKRKDAHGMIDGETPFARAYTNKTVVQLEAPKKVGDNVFHHWDLNGEFAGASAKLRVVVTNHATAAAIYLTNYAARTMSFKIKGMKDYLVAQDFSPPLSVMLANGTTAFQVRDMASLAVVDGPYPVTPMARGLIWLYNGTRTRSAVIKVFPEENVLVYVSWANLPDALQIEAVSAVDAQQADVE